MDDEEVLIVFIRPHGVGEVLGPAGMRGRSALPLVGLLASESELETGSVLRVSEVVFRLFSGLGGGDDEGVIHL